MRAYLYIYVCIYTFSYIYNVWLLPSPHPMHTSQPPVTTTRTGGVQKEFYQIITRKMFDRAYGVRFPFHRLPSI